MNTAFWSFTINNYTETDLALVQQGYPDHVRQIVYTLEKGEEKGTPHVQGYLKLFRQQRESYVRKLFPRAAFKGITCAEYNLNAQRYAQKLDQTAESPAVITNNPFPDPIVELVSVIEEAFSRPDLNEWSWNRPQTWVESQPTEDIIHQWLTQVEFDRVRRSPRLVKFYVSATYRNVKKEYLRPLKAHIFDLQKIEHTHTHTHVTFEPAQESSDSVNIPEIHADEDFNPPEEDEEQEDEDYEEASPDETDSECSDSTCEEGTDEDC